MLRQSQCGGCDGGEPVRYRHTLTVQSPNEATLDAGGHVDPTSSSNWTTEGTIKANFLSKGGREFIHGEKVGAEVSHVLETPSNNFSRGILPSWRLTFDSRTFQIIAAYDKDEMRQKVIIHVKEER